MIKYFCDVCEAEITAANSADGRVKAVSGPLTVEVITGWHGTANDGIFCKYCIIDAVNKADDRTRPANG